MQELCVKMWQKRTGYYSVKGKKIHIYTNPEDMYTRGSEYRINCNNIVHWHVRYWYFRLDIEYVKEKSKMTMKINQFQLYSLNRTVSSFKATLCRIWQLFVCWSKHACNAVILPSHWRYTEQKQVIAETETPFSLLQDTVPSTWF